MNKLINVAVKNDPAFCPNNCGHSYRGLSRKKNLKAHLILACGVNPKFKCDICYKKFVRKHTLISHLLNKHN